MKFLKKKPHPAHRGPSFLPVKVNSPRKLPNQRKRQYRASITKPITYLIQKFHFLLILIEIHFIHYTESYNHSENL